MEIPQESPAGPTPPHFAHKFTVFQELGESFATSSYQVPNCGQRCTPALLCTRCPNDLEQVTELL